MKFLKWFGITVAVLAILFFLFGMPYLRQMTKKLSPEKSAAYTRNNMDLSVTYSSPFKKGRVIFGELVPYGEVWRTGANEPTTFTTATDIRVADQKLPSGTYSLWTRPEKEKWSVIFNKGVPGWGVRGGETARDPNEDVVTVEVPVEKLSSSQESFLIDFEETDGPYLTLSWDETKIRVPISD